MQFISAKKLAALGFTATIFASVVHASAAVEPMGAQYQTKHYATVASAKTVRYVIRSGDTLWNIAHKNHISLASLTQANPRIHAGHLVPGHSLIIPQESVKSAPHQAKLRSATWTYAKEIHATATAYTPAQGSIDRLGQPVKFGVIAVDPNIIPLGSKVRVTGMHMPGFPSTFTAIAGDTGGAIKGDRIDVFLPVSNQRAMDFGVQHLKIYVM